MDTLKQMQHVRKRNKYFDIKDINEDFESIVNRIMEKAEKDPEFCEQLNKAIEKEEKGEKINLLK